MKSGRDIPVESVFPVSCGLLWDYRRRKVERAYNRYQQATFTDYDCQPGTCRAAGKRIYPGTVGRIFIDPGMAFNFFKNKVEASG